MKKVSTWVAVSIGVSTLRGTACTVDSRYAKAEDISTIKDYIQQVDRRLEIKILKDRANAIQERMWKIEDRYGMDIAKMPETIRDQYRKLKKEYDEINEKIKKDNSP